MTLIDRYGVARVVGAAAVLLIVLYYAGTLGLAKAKAWYYKSQVEHVTDQRDQARDERDVARKDAEQTDRSAGITAITVAAQDQHAANQRAATRKIVETIHERIREVPVAVPASDDVVVRDAVEEARTRAQAAADRLRRTPDA